MSEHGAGGLGNIVVREVIEPKPSVQSLLVAMRLSAMRVQGRPRSATV
jgi:hypothetical protein